MHTCQIVICLLEGMTPYVYEAKYFSYWKGGWHKSPKNYFNTSNIVGAWI